MKKLCIRMMMNKKKCGKGDNKNNHIGRKKKKTKTTFIMADQATFRAVVASLTKTRFKADDEGRSDNGGGGGGDNGGGSGGGGCSGGGGHNEKNGGGDGNGGDKGGGGKSKGMRMDFMGQAGFGYNYGYHAGNENGYPVGQLQCAQVVQS